MTMTAIATDEPRRCPVCKTELPERSGVGRPRTYCSMAHKETAKRRRVAHLARIGRAVETALQETRCS